MRALVVLLVATCAPALAGCGGDAEPRPDLVVVSTRDGDYALYAMNADGGRQKRLDDTPPDLSSARGVFFQVEPDWSPDGTTIVFASRRSGRFDLYVTNADGSGTRRLTSARVNERAPSFSPDGTQIAFVRGTPGRLHVMSADGSGAARAISDDAADELDPAWSPDGEWIAFSRQRPGTEVREIWVVRPDGSDRRRVTSLGGASYGPAWSPDGERMAFASDARESRLEIYTIGVDGSGLQRLTRSGDDAFDPAWSPDGETIAFSRGGAIFTIDAEGREERLTSERNNDSSPLWNPRPPPDD